MKVDRLERDIQDINSWKQESNAKIETIVPLLHSMTNRKPDTTIVVYQHPVVPPDLKKANVNPKPKQPAKKSTN